VLLAFCTHPFALKDQTLQAQQKIFRIRRDYNSWVANETLEDYALRYTPRHFRRWSEFRVANTAFGASSFLALEAIGGAIALSYGFENALWAILVVGLITFLTGLPISYYAAKYGIDMDLLTRGAGFGYLGSTLTSLIYASFTFIFFALEAAILALALQLALGWPLAMCYLIASLGIIPLVMHGITLISRIQTWTQPVWLVLLVCPYAFIAWKQPSLYSDFTSLTGLVSGSSSFDTLMFGAAATVAFSLVVQIGEQVDYLRFLPEKTPANRIRWWSAVLVSGPGWIIPGMLKMLGGAFLALLVLQLQLPVSKAIDPTQMYLAGFAYVFTDPRWILAATVVFVIVSQVKINVTNAYAGSLAWSNFFARLTHSHPGRVVWLVFNVTIALLLMALGVFGALERVLGLYGNVAIAWVGALVADLIINKPMGWSPRQIEFRRAYLYDLNPVGLGAMLPAAALGIVSYVGVLGPTAQAFAPFIALLTALLLSPLIAWRTKGKYYLARKDPPRWKPSETVQCSVCENKFESEDMAWCPAYGAPICSLCCTLESRCRDQCKTQSRAAEQVRGVLVALLPQRLSQRINFQMAHYLVVAVSMVGLLALILGLVYEQQSNLVGADTANLRAGFWRAFTLLSLVAAVAAWWTVLSSESRQMAEDETHRQNNLLTSEIEAHSRTDAALKSAKDAADSANQAKTRYVTGITHELRTPLNSILGYTQILLKNESVQAETKRALTTMHHSGEHMRGLVDGLLDLARIEAGRVRLDLAALPMREFLNDLVSMVAPEAAIKGIVFSLELHGRVPDFVKADAKRLRQILLNLLSNAVRFTTQGSVILRVDYTREVTYFQVIDTGAGIEPGDFERIFMPFERGSAGRRSTELGTGLGLTITQLLVQMMGGELTVQSISGKGSTFTARLYLSETFTPEPQLVPNHRPVSGYIGARRHLLVVDDQASQRQMLAGMLLPLGFKLREAASALECIDSVLKDPPDAVLLDVSMDEQDGWYAAQQIRVQGFMHLPIIMVSANAFENLPEKMAAHNVQAFVDKPVIESELLQALARHLQLEWVTDLPASSWVLAPVISAQNMPASYHSTLARLARLGHVKGLHEALDRLRKEQPTCQELAESLRTYVQRCAFDELIALLALPSNDKAAETP
jgi:signal transduction histidine kinase/CheY-like chemotaxis protein